MNAPAAPALQLIPEATRLLIRDRDARLAMRGDAMR